MSEAVSEGKDKPVFEAEVYDLDVTVKLHSFSDDGRAIITFEVSAEIDLEDLKQLKPIFDYTKRIQPNKYAVWKMKFEHLRDEQC